jgi:signal transduction histidine kinase
MGEPIAAAGGALPAPSPGQTKSGWLTGHPPAFALRLPDARWLVVRRAWGARQGPVGVVGVLALIALAVGIGAYPVIRRLTRRLERLQAGVEALGAGELSARVAVQGCDEVARLAASFNQSAARIEALVLSQKALLANASHELRAPLARLRMAFELIDDGAGTDTHSEIARNIAELDQLIEEILLASRLEAGQATDAGSIERFDFTALVAEECARAQAELCAAPVMLTGEARLLRRLVRNLLENARRYGAGSPIEVALAPLGGQRVELAVSDRGPGIPEEHRQRIFDPFYRLPGTREGDGGIGLGLALVRGIAEKHGGSVRCEAGSSGGTRFVVVLPE